MKLLKGIFKYEAIEEGDLNISVNDVIEFLYTLSENWYIGLNLMTNQTGAFPFNFVEELKIPNDIDIDKLYVILDDCDTHQRGDLFYKVDKINEEIIGSKIENGLVLSSVSKCQSLKKLNLDISFIKYKATELYESSNLDELSFKPDDIIWMDKKISEDLGHGYCNGNKGYFKLKNVQCVLNEDQEFTNSGKNSRENRWICLYDYKTNENSDLVVTKGDKLSFVDKIDENWFLMKNCNNKVGLIPSNFIKNISVTSQLTLNNDSKVKKIPKRNSWNSLNDFQLENKLTPSKAEIIISNDANHENRPSINSFKNQEIKLLNDLELINQNIDVMKKRLQNSNLDENEASVIKKNLDFLTDDWKLRNQDIQKLKDEMKNLSNQKVKDNNLIGMQDVIKSEKDIEDKMFRIRRKAIEELQSTENKYYLDIKATLDIFIKEEMEQYISSSDYKILFGDLKSILSLSKEFYDSISKITMRYEHALIGKVFMDFISLFDENYKEYCLNYEKKTDLIAKKSNDVKWNEVINIGLSKFPYNETLQIIRLEDMLSKPFQRFFKYQLFLKTIKDNTPLNHEDYENVCEALNQVELISRKCNEKKRFEELKTQIFEKYDQYQYVKVMHGLRKVPKRFVASIYSNPSAEDVEFVEAVNKFRNIKKCISFFIETVFMLRDNMKEVMNLYSSMTNNLEFVSRTSFGSLLAQYLVICKNSESEYEKTYKSTLDSRVINPLISLLDLFTGPKILIKKRQNKFLDYSATKQKLEMNKEVTHKQQDKLEELKSQYNVINDTLKDELPKLVSKSICILNECVANFLQMTTTLLSSSTSSLKKLLISGDMNIEEFSKLCRNQQNELLSYLSKNCKCGKLLYQDPAIRQKLDPNSDSSLRSSVYSQTFNDVEDLKSKYEIDNLMIVKKEFKPTKSHQVHLCAGDIVGVAKRCDPQGNTTSWLVEISVKNRRMGFVPRSYLNVFTQNDAHVSNAHSEKKDCVRSNSLRLQSGNLFVNNNHFDFLPSSTNRASSLSYKQSRLSTIETKSEFDELNPQQPPLNIRTALYKHISRGPSEVSLNIGDRIQILREQDNVGNLEWSLVKNLRTSMVGYVPSNYLSQLIPINTTNENAQINLTFS